MSKFVRYGVTALTACAMIALFFVIIAALEPILAPSGVPSKGGVPLPFWLQVLMSGTVLVCFAAPIALIITDTIDEIKQDRADRAYSRDYQRLWREQREQLFAGSTTAKTATPKRIIDDVGYDPDDND